MLANQHLLRYSTFAIGASEMTAISDLLDRVEKATGPDREIDAALFIELTPGVKEAGRIDRLGGDVGWWPKNAPYHSAETVPAYTASIDAALALVERKLPNAMRRVFDDMDGAGAHCDLILIDGSVVRCAGASWPLAIIAALLRALESETPA